MHPTQPNPDQPQDPQNSKSDSSCPKKKQIIFRVIIVILALACCGLSILAMSASVTYFSYLFSLTTELIAKAYLKVNYGWFMAAMYTAVMGLVVVVGDTFVFFTTFTQKDRILGIHVAYFIFMFVTGIVALTTGADHLAEMMQYSVITDCTVVPATTFQCKLGPAFLIYRGNVVSYFIGNCICFFAYGAVYHVASYQEKKEREEKLQEPNSKIQLHNQSEVLDNKKNMSIMNYDENSL